MQSDELNQSLKSKYDAHKNILAKCTKLIQNKTVMITNSITDKLYHIEKVNKIQNKRIYVELYPLNYFSQNITLEELSFVNFTPPTKKLNELIEQSIAVNQEINYIKNDIKSFNDNSKYNLLRDIVNNKSLVDIITQNDSNFDEICHDYFSEYRGSTGNKFLLVIIKKEEE